MKKSMVAYVNNLSESTGSGEGLDTLLTIIEFQYKKFLEFYRLVSEFSEYIHCLNYYFTSESSLDITITLSDKKTAKKTMTRIIESVKNSKYESSVEEVNSLSLNISLIYNESWGDKE